MQHQQQRADMLQLDAADQRASSDIQGDGVSDAKHVWGLASGRHAAQPID